MNKATAMLLEEALKEISSYHKEWQSLFVWHDGTLVQAMRNGDMFLVDTLSLAEDSVLERLNNVLQPILFVIYVFLSRQLFVFILFTSRLTTVDNKMIVWCS